MEVKVFDLPEHLSSKEAKIKIQNDNSGWGWKLVMKGKGLLSLPTLKSPEKVKQVIDAVARQVGRKNVEPFLRNCHI